MLKCKWKWNLFGLWPYKYETRSAHRITSVCDICRSSRDFVVKLLSIDSIEYRIPTFIRTTIGTSMRFKAADVFFFIFKWFASFLIAVSLPYHRPTYHFHWVLSLCAYFWCVSTQLFVNGHSFYFCYFPLVVLSILRGKSIGKRVCEKRSRYACEKYQVFRLVIGRINHISMTCWQFFFIFLLQK